MNDGGEGDELTLDESASWWGSRFGRVIDPSGGAAAETIANACAWCLHQRAQGHACLDFELPVVANSRGSDRVSAHAPRAWLAALASHPRVQQSERGSSDETRQLLVLEGTQLFLAACRHSEIVVARQLCAMAREKCLWSIAAAAATSPPDRAIAAVRRHRLSIITGGPGTGKTTIASRMADAVLRDHDVEVALIAPTGKAAKRLESSMRQRIASHAHDYSQRGRAVLSTLAASTIHAALSARGGDALARKRLVIVDESSMIALDLMRKLFERLDPQSSLVLLGDAHQLASVEAGSVFADMLPRAEDVDHPLAGCTVRLTDNYRFPVDGVVARIAGAVNDGSWEQVESILGEDPSASVRWHEVTSADETLAACFDAHRELPASQILCGHRRGRDGSLAVNRMLAKRVGKAANPDPADGEEFEGRPIIVTANDPVTGLSNGDTGIVRRNSAGEFEVQIDGTNAPLQIAQLPRHEAAYAITIHKSQGSEYPSVIIVLPVNASPVVTRELLYTAITRTTGRVLIIATRASLRSAVEQRIHRASGLRARVLRGA